MIDTNHRTRDKRDVLEVLIASTAGLVMAIIIGTVLFGIGVFELPSPDTTCRDAESLQMRDDCNFGRNQ